MSTTITRREFLHRSLIMGAGMSLNRRFFLAQDGTTLVEPPTAPFEVTGSIAPIHDPVIIRGEDAYYLFCTGVNIPVRRSVDLVEWKTPYPTTVHRFLPPWAAEAIPGTENPWAPDIAYFNGKYHLYYSVSTFGSNRSAIGLATNTTLNSDDDAFEWVDQGLVIDSQRSDTHNCIDPNIILDEDGVPWMSFGSFWSGIKMRRLDLETGKLSSEDETLYPLAFRLVNSNSVEAPFIVRRGDFYYLFVSFDFCCRGVDSTYRVMVGRSETVTGPYVDRDGVEMLRGGGTQVTFPDDRWKGPGHCSVLRENDTDYLVYHAYDAERNGTPTLRISILQWDDEGWPSVL